MVENQYSSGEDRIRKALRGLSSDITFNHDSKKVVIVLEKKFDQIVLGIHKPKAREKWRDVVLNAKSVSSDIDDLFNNNYSFILKKPKVKKLYADPRFKNITTLLEINKGNVIKDFTKKA